MEERQIDRSELYVADEIFFSGTATELTWAESVDNVVIGREPGPVFTKLKQGFKNILNNPEDNRLTIVK